MADWHGMVGKLGRVDGYGRRRTEEFEEEDVWSVVKEVEDSSTPKNHYNSFSSSSSSSASHLPASAPRMIPRTHVNNNNSSPKKQESKKVGIQQCSAPLNIPDWSKIYGKNSRMGSSWIDDDDGYDDDVDGHGHGYDDDVDGHGHGHDDDDGMIPPHEWIAMKLARSQISSFSVYEGIGRTLKGRDLSKVRNAILTKTGFLE